MPTSDKTLICKFWLKGQCRRTPCDFAHGEEEKKAACRLLPCQFFASGSCRLGPDCLYRHDLEADSSGDEEKDVGSGCEVKSASTTASEGPDGTDTASLPSATESNYRKDRSLGKFDKTKLCMFWQGGRCQRGAMCKYAHGEDERRAACAAIPCKHWQLGTCHDEDCAFAHDVASPLARNRREASPPRARPSRDKTLLCKFWLKNRCQRQHCNFAHGEEEKRRACKQIPCIFEAGCRLGAECLYAHSWETDRPEAQDTHAETSATGDSAAERRRDSDGSNTDDLNSVSSATPSPSGDYPGLCSWVRLTRQSWADLVEGEEDM